MSQPSKSAVIRHMVDQHGYNPGAWFDNQSTAEIIGHHAQIEHPAKPPTGSQAKHTHATWDPSQWHMEPPPGKTGSPFPPVFRDRRQGDGTTARSDILAEERKAKRGW